MATYWPAGLSNSMLCLICQITALAAAIKELWITQYNYGENPRSSILSLHERNLTAPCSCNPLQLRCLWRHRRRHQTCSHPGLSSPPPWSEWWCPSVRNLVILGLTKRTHLGVVDHVRGPVFPNDLLVFPAADSNNVWGLEDPGKLECRDATASAGSDDEESPSLGQLAVISEALEGGQVGDRQCGSLGEG